MKLTTLSDQVWLQRDGVEEAWRGCDPSRPLHPDSREYSRALSIPTGLTFQTRDGLVYTLRRVTAADVGLLDAFVRRLSDRTRRLRFMTMRPYTPEAVHAEIARLMAGSAGSAITLLTTEGRGEAGAVVAVAELVCEHASSRGEVGLAVMDDAQRKGLGSLLLRQLVQLAQELGLAHLHGDMLAENYVMRRLIQALRLPYTATLQAGEIHIIIDVPQEPQELGDRPPRILAAVGQLGQDHER